MSDVQILVAVIAFAGAIGTAVLAARQKGMSDLVAAQAKRIDQLEQAAEKRDARIEKLERRERIAEQYIDALRDHINQHKPPPPPPWPHDL